MRAYLAAIASIVIVFAAARGVAGTGLDSTYYNVDTTPPLVTITSPSALTTSSSTITISGAANDDLSVIGVSWSTDTGASGSCVGLSSWSAAGVPLANGDNVIMVVAEDAAGNIGVDWLNIAYQPPVYPPVAVQILTPTSTHVYQSSSSRLSISGAASGGPGIQSVSWCTDHGYSGICAGTTTWSAAGITLVEGENVLTVTARDTTGQTASDTLAITYTPPPDTVAPVVTITSPTSNSTFATQNQSISLGGVATDNASVATIAWSNDRGGNGPCTGTDSWETGGIVLADGQNVITVTATDPSGNTGSAVLTVSCARPQILTVAITTPIADQPYSTSNTSIDISGTVAGGSGAPTVSWSNDRGGSGTCAGGASWTAAGVPVVPGRNIVALTARDTAGNAAISSLTVNCTDIAAPSVQITGPTSNNTYSTDQDALSISGTASDNFAVASVTWSNDRGGSGTCTGTGSWTAGGIELQSGDNKITVTAQDASGNSATDSLTVTYNTPVVSLPPSVAITVPTAASTYSTNNQLLDIGGVASDEKGLSSVTWSNDRGGGGTCAGTTSWSAAGIALALGGNTITVTARDVDNNTSQAALIVTYSLPPDTTAPSVSITSPTSGSAYPTSTSVLAIGGAASDNVGVTQVTWAIAGGGSGTCAGTTVWSAAGITLRAGTNVVTVTARDAAGNTATATLTVTYTPPPPVLALAITSPTANATYTTTATSIDISGTASSTSDIAGVAWVNDRGGSGDCAGAAQWTASNIPLSLGDNVVTVTVRDSNGNTASDSLTVTRTEPSNQDMIPPSVTITSPTDGPTYTAATQTLSIGGTAYDNIAVSAVEWSSDRGGGGTCTGTASWSADGIALRPGVNVITVRATDGANNNGSDTLTVTLPDTHPPSVTITSPVSKSSYDTTTKSLTLAGSAADDDHIAQITWTNDRGGSGTCTGAVSWTSTRITLQLGANHITITARDASGNTATDTLLVNYSDTSPPSVTIASPTAGATYSTTARSITVGGAASDNEALAAISWTNDRGGSGTCAGTTSWSSGQIPLMLGINQITITARDSSGNTSVDTLAVSYSDKRAPTILISSPMGSGKHITRARSIAIDGIATDDVAVASVTWSSNRAAGGTCQGTEAWSIPDVPLVPGDNVITITATDTSGNSAAAEVTITYNDGQSPVVSIVTPTSSGSYETAAPSIDISGSASDSVGIASLAWSNDRGGAGSCAGTTAWLAESIPLAMGTNVISIAATDSLGNTGSAELTVVRKDTQSPLIAILRPTERSSVATTNSQLQVSGTASDNGGVAEVTWSSDRGGGGVCSGTAAWTLADLDLQPGHNIVTVTARDADGNSTSTSIDIDFIGVEPPEEWYGLAMISVPLIPDEADPKLAVGFDGNYWCEYEADLKTYGVYGNDPDRLTWFLPAESTPGRAFWARFAGNAKMPLGIAPPQDQPATVHLYSGWNMIGQPFLSETQWDTTAIMVRTSAGALMSLKDASARNILRNYAFGWQHDSSDPNTGAYYEIEDASEQPGAVSTLVPWRAYWVRSFAECDLIFPPPE